MRIMALSKLPKDENISDFVCAVDARSVFVVCQSAVRRPNSFVQPPDLLQTNMAEISGTGSRSDRDDHGRNG